MLDIFIGNCRLCCIDNNAKGAVIKQQCKELLGVNEDEIYLISQGRLVSNTSVVSNGSVHVCLRNVGGKGGFGSMLRAIGAQIEKTTNREACRDLSGRRLRDINEEKRLKTWIAQQVDREQEAADNKQKKLERLCEPPRHEFKDEAYENERSALPEKVEDAVLQGLKVAEGKEGVKRKQATTSNVKKKKQKLWLDADEDFGSTSGEDSETDTPSSTSQCTKTEVSA
ncbi:hypothetical protein PPYR_06335 [Photinus pyralis]|uniref:SDE2-like domain-containing protein n=2 Tax=Photinus pyralis TaxID=7054 RepID=A0A5N4AT96_PHOPY|nr:replication stress response regulator SDE2 [Photinus pyralis]KAB0800595.1 hypothetical protein PPYR_06335 [Photinus pyralis]